MAEEEHLIGEVNTFNTIYSDVITFIAALFILLFSLSYTEDTGKSIFDTVQLQMQQKEDQTLFEQKQAEVDNLLDQRVSQFVTTEFQQQQIRVALNDPIVFSYKETGLREGHKDVIAHFLSLISELPNTIVIQGSASESESEEAVDIAYNRAKNVYTYMVNSLGFPKERLVIQSSGVNPQQNIPEMLQQNVSLYIVRAVKR